MESIADLWGRRRTALPLGKVLNERAELIKFFCDKVHRKPQQLGTRLAHYTLSELYALKSAFTDREKRDGIVRAQKHFWWITKTEEI